MADVFINENICLQISPTIGMNLLCSSAGPTRNTTCCVQEIPRLSHARAQEFHRLGPEKPTSMASLAVAAASDAARQLASARVGARRSAAYSATRCHMIDFSAREPLQRSRAAAVAALAFVA